MSKSIEEFVECRGCGMKLKKIQSRYAGISFVYHPVTKKQLPFNQYS